MITAESWAKAVFSVVNQCHYPHYQFHVGVEGNLVTLRVVFEGFEGTDERGHAVPDVTTGETQMGRLWVIEFGAHPQQIVQTVFKALLTSVEHRVREGFGFQGRAVMGPHRSLQEMMGVPMGGVATGGEAPLVGGPPFSRSEERRQAALRESEGGIPEHRTASESVRVVVDSVTPPPWR